MMYHLEMFKIGKGRLQEQECNTGGLSPSWVQKSHFVVSPKSSFIKDRVVYEGKVLLCKGLHFH